MSKKIKVVSVSFHLDYKNIEYFVNIVRGCWVIRDKFGSKLFEYAEQRTHQYENKTRAIEIFNMYLKILLYDRTSKS